MRYALVIFSALFLQSCNERIEGQKPVNHIKVLSNHIVVELDQGYCIDSVLDMSLFQNLKPGINSRKASEVLGIRGNFVQVSKYVQYVEFITGRGRLRIMEEYSLETGISNWLELIPYEFNIDKLVIPQIAREIDISDADLEKVYVYTFDKAEFLTLTILNGQVKNVTWLNR